MESATLEAPVSTVREIESVEDLDAALAALGEMDAQEATANADLDLELTKVRESFEPRYLVTFDEAENQPLAVVRTDLTAAVERFCNAHRKELLTGKTKSVKLTHGTIGWDKVRDSVKVIEQPQSDGDQDVKKRTGILDYALGLAQKALSGVKRLFTRFPLLDVIRLEVHWDKVQILTLFKKKQITEKQLEKAGLAVVIGQEKFYATPKADAS